MNKIRINPVDHAYFVNHLCYAPVVESFHNVVQNVPVGGCLKDFWQIWASNSASLIVVCYNLPFKVKPPLTRDPISCKYGPPTVAIHE